ncbi:MAG: NAD-binding protein [Bacteroidales bacterium]|nr:NAD-binding protein [Bacteroidales bacterium]
MKELRSSRKRIAFAFTIMLVILFIGIMGYMLIEGDNLLDSIYMTIITISTVGYGEIHELSKTGKIFTIFLVITSFGTYAYVVSIITTYFVEGQMRYIIRGYRVKSIQKKMKDHVIVCGYGRNGQQVIKELIANNYKFVIIDKEQEGNFSKFDQPVHFIEGDATEDEILLKAAIQRAEALITTLPIDADNLFVVLSARSLNPKIKIVSRASNISSEKKLRVAGADNVVMPEQVGGAHMANLIARSDAVEFLDRLSIHGEEPVNFEEIVCDHLLDSIKDKTIYEIGVKTKTGVNIVGLKTPEGEFIFNPSSDIIIVPKSKLFVLGTQEQIKKMKEILSQNHLK